MIQGSNFGGDRTFLTAVDGDGATLVEPLKDRSSLIIRFSAVSIGSPYNNISVLHFRKDLSSRLPFPILEDVITPPHEL